MTASTSPCTFGEWTLTSSSAAPNVIWVDLFQPKDVPVPPDFEDLDAIVARDEKIPARQSKLADARRALAARETQRITGLSALRLSRGWAQKRVAEEVGTSQSHIARLELGNEDILMSTARKLARALGVPIEQIDVALRVRGGLSALELRVAWLAVTASRCHSGILLTLLVVS